MEIILDLSKEGKLNPEYSRHFDEIAISVKDEFNELIDQLNSSIGDHLLWMLSSPSSRNPYSSKLFYHYCCLNLLNEIDLTDIKAVLVDSQAMHSETVKIVKRKNALCAVHNVNHGIFKTLSIYMHKFNTITQGILKFILPYFVGKFLKKNMSLPEDLILIDTFVGPGFVEKDRYYHGLLDTLDATVHEKVFFAPQYTAYSGLKEFIQLIHDTRKSERNFLFKEDFISFVEIVKIVFALLWYAPTIPKLNSKNISFDLLVEEDLYNRSSFYSILCGLQNYTFFKNLKQNKLSIKNCINWFENQQVSKGWNKGFNKFFTESKLKGYKGAIDCNLYLCFQAIRSEVDLGYTPREVYVLGPASLEQVDYQTIGIKAKLAPAFRYQTLLSIANENPEKKEMAVLLCLPIGELASIDILAMTIPVLNNCGVKVFIKRHPAGQTRKWLIQHTGTQPANNIFWVDGDFHSLLKDISIFIGSSSSTCFDAILYQKDVIIISTSGFSYNYIPDDIDKSAYDWVYNEAEFKKCLQSRLERERSYKKIDITNYFSPLSKNLCQSLIE